METIYRTVKIVQKEGVVDDYTMIDKIIEASVLLHKYEKMLKPDKKFPI